MDYTQFFQQLSAVIQQRFSEFTDSSILSALHELSSVPVHPYERLKYDTFGKDFTFKTINDLEAPTDFDPNTYMQQLTCITDKTQQTSLSSLSSFAEVVQTGSLTACQVEIIPQPVLRHNLEFIEIVKSLNIEDVKARPMEIAQKLTSFYIKGY